MKITIDLDKIEDAAIFGQVMIWHCFNKIPGKQLLKRKRTGDIPYIYELDTSSFDLKSEFRLLDPDDSRDRRRHRELARLILTEDMSSFYVFKSKQYPTSIYVAWLWDEDLNKTVLLIKAGKKIVVKKKRIYDFEWSWIKSE